MAKWLMCRICLVQNVRMYVVVNENLQELYEKLTDAPFVTEDSRPMLACYFCCTKLKQCYQFQRKCLEAEELFAQMMNEDYELKPLINQEHQVFCNGFTQSPIEHLTIAAGYQTENIAIKEELIAASERLEDIVELKELCQSDIKLHEQNWPSAGQAIHELELEYRFSDVEDVPAQHSELIFNESESEDVPLIEYNIDVEEQEASRNKRSASDMQRTLVATKSKLKDVIAEEQKKNEQSNTKVIGRTTENCTFRTVAELREFLKNTKHGVDDYSSDRRNKTEMKCEKSSKITVSDFMNRNRSLSVKDKSFKCDVCQRCFKKNINFRKHIRTHSVEKPFKCDICQRCLNNKYSFAKHIRAHAGGENPYKCDVCQRAFREKFSLTRHIRLHTGEKPYECDFCRRGFTDISNLRRHIRLHTGEKPFDCDVCQRRFSEKAHLTYHKRTHTVKDSTEHVSEDDSERPYKCDICQRSFKIKWHLTQHLEIHAGKPFTCDICQRSFKVKWHLTQHIKIHAGKPFKCDICQRGFNQKGSLTHHIRIHSADKHFKCDICQCGFNQKSSLISHIYTHTGQKPFKCDVCDNCYRTRSALNTHNRIVHLGEKPCNSYKCEVCHCVFAKKRILTKHICVGTSKEPFKCDV